LGSLQPRFGNVEDRRPASTFPPDLPLASIRYGAFVARKRDLAEYETKRDFTATPEPPARIAPRKSRARAKEQVPRFVVQEHHARALHWDLRLERDGVLASWAVPKGIPSDPKRNHLAVQTEDHPLEYLTFKGEIPAGEYGGGSMGVWDTGTYETHKWSDREVMITLHGERVHGKYVLFRTRDKQWMIHRMDPPEDPELAAPPNDLRPMLATLKTAAPRGDGWSFELKWDGIRAIGYVDGGRIRLLSRNGNDVTSRYPELRRLGETLGTRDVVLDGEIVAFDESGRPSFELLQRRMHVTSDSTIRRLVGEVPVTYVLFDLLWLDGHSTMDKPYVERRALLRELALNGASWQTPPNEEGDGAATIEVSKRFGLEGIVAKRLDSRYEPGRRSPAWIKVKNQLRQEFVVGGWQPGEKSRTGSIGSLLLGYYDGDVLHYAGKAGSGLTGPVITDLEKLFEKTARTDSPFGAGRVPKGVRFVEPLLVVEVRFTEWTSVGNIRHPTFLGTRTDKDPREVVRETPV
jgi:bifunctional non-homologous end joining protein LigD